MHDRAFVTAICLCLAACSSAASLPTDATGGMGGRVEPGATGGSLGKGGAGGQLGSGGAALSGGSSGAGVSAGAGGVAPSGGAGGVAPSGGTGGVALSGGTGGVAPSGGSGGVALSGGAGGIGLSGGAGMSGGTGGGAAGSVATGGAPACAGLVCDDFESGAIDTQKWDVLMSGGTLTVQTKQVASGKYALLVHGLGSGGDDWAQLVVKNPPAALKGNTTYGRANLYFSGEAASSLHMSLPFAGHNGTGPANGPAPYPKLRRLELGTYFGGWQLGMDLHDVSPLLEDVSHPNGKWPTNKWVCLEWEFEDQPDRITVWIGGSLIGTFDNSNATSPSGNGAQNGQLYMGTSSGLIGGFDLFYIGFHDWHPTKAFDLYYDDVVLDAKRVGCPSSGN